MFATAARVELDCSRKSAPAERNSIVFLVCPGRQSACARTQEERGRELTRLVYIGGYGHSGSTLLEYLMAGSPDVLACGEVVSCLRERKKKNCTCGRTAPACPLWGFFYSSNRPPIKTYAELLRTLIQRVEGQYSAIVDSSKTAWGALSKPFHLRKKFGSDFMLIHLVRQPAAVCWSVLKKKDRRGKRQGRRSYHALRCGLTVLAWSVANLSCDLFGWIYPRQYVRVRYEDLVRSPTETLPMLFESCLPGVKLGICQN